MFSCCDTVVGITVAVGVGTVTARGEMLVGAMAIGRMLAMTLDPAI